VYPPILVPATMCYIKLLLALDKLGHNIEVVTVDIPTFDRLPNILFDETLHSELPPGVVNHPIKSREKHWLYRAMARTETTKYLFRDHVVPRKREWVGPALSYLRRPDFDLSRFDMVISCSQPHVNYLIGLGLRDKVDIPWMAYFSDPWTDMPWKSRQNPRFDRYNLQLESSVIEAADSILFTSDETTDKVMEKYSPEIEAKCGVLPHSYAPSWYGKSRSDWEPSKGPVTIVHTGHFYGDRTPMPLFKPLAALHKETPLEDKVRLVMFGKMEDEHMDFVRTSGLSNIVDIRDPIPYLESLNVLSKADYLLVLDAETSDGSPSMFLPSKLVDYLGADKPIIGITPRTGASARVLGQTGHLLVDVSSPRRSPA
jgi:hypothetical protein